MQRYALACLFGAIALSLGAIALWSALAGGRAIVIAIAAALLAAWMADLAWRVRPRRRPRE